MKSALILYELEQLAFLEALVTENGGFEKIELVSLDAEIDYALEKKEIPFISGRILQNRIEPASYLRAKELTGILCDEETLGFLRYRNIKLLEPLRFSLHIYLIVLLYYIDIIGRLVEQRKDIKRLLVPAPSTPTSATSGFLADHEVFSVVEAVRRVAEGNSMQFEVVRGAPISVRASNKLQKLIFTTKRALFGVGVLILNAYLSLQPRRSVRILASDYWRNISPVLREIPEAELFLLDRSEAFKAGLKNIWKHKIRFIHIDNFLTRKNKKETLLFAETCSQKWQEVRTSVWEEKDLTFSGVSLVSLCDRVMTRLIERAIPQIACDIEGTYALYANISPSTVWLRASVSAQQHFTILPLVAKQMNIPSLEVQHGGEYLGPGSATTFHAAEYIATYGSLVMRELQELGYSEGRLFAVGSPRFDAYIEDARNASHQTHKGLIVLSNTPSGNVGERFGSYSVEEYFKALGEAVGDIQNLRLMIASRSLATKAAFNEDARARGLKSTPYEHVGTTPLPVLFQQADVFVCSHSTVVYEALLYRLPVVVASFAPVEQTMTNFHFSQFEKAGALRIAHTPDELTVIMQEISQNPEKRIAMSKAGWDYMRENFSFDGQASARLANIIRRWMRGDHH